MYRLNMSTSIRFDANALFGIIGSFNIFISRSNFSNDVFSVSSMTLYVLFLNLYTYSLRYNGPNKGDLQYFKRKQSCLLFGKKYEIKIFNEYLKNALIRILKKT